MEKTFEQIQKKEKYFTSLMNVIFFVIIVAVMMIVLSIVSSL